SLNLLIEHMESFYFSDRGILPFLKAIADGKPIDIETFHARWREFQEGARSVAVSLDNANQIIGRREAALGYELSDWLKMIGHGKSHVRFVIGDLVQYLQQQKFCPQSFAEASHQAASIIDQIGVLNKSISLVRQRLEQYKR